MVGSCLDGSVHVGFLKFLIVGENYKYEMLEPVNDAMK